MARLMKDTLKIFNQNYPIFYILKKNARAFLCIGEEITMDRCMYTCYRHRVCVYIPGL